MIMKRWALPAAFLSFTSLLIGVVIFFRQRKRENTAKKSDTTEEGTTPSTFQGQGKTDWDDINKPTTSGPGSPTNIHAESAEAIDIEPSPSMIQKMGFGPPVIISPGSCSSITSISDASNAALSVRSDLDPSDSCCSLFVESPVGRNGESEASQSSSVYSTPLTEEQFQESLTSPIVNEAQFTDNRIRQMNIANNSIGGVIVQDLEEFSRHNTLDDAVHSIYDSYNSIVPPNQPNTGIIFKLSGDQQKSGQF